MILFRGRMRMFKTNLHSPKDCSGKSKIINSMEVLIREEVKLRTILHSDENKAKAFCSLCLAHEIKQVSWSDFFLNFEDGV